MLLPIAIVTKVQDYKNIAKPPSLAQSKFYHLINIDKVNHTWVSKMSKVFSNISDLKLSWSMKCSKKH